jgi:CHAT domain-containing protein
MWQRIVCTLIFVVGALGSGFAQQVQPTAFADNPENPCKDTLSVEADELALGNNLTKDIQPPQTHWYKVNLLPGYFTRIGFKQLSTDLLMTVCNSQKEQVSHEEFARNQLSAVPVTLSSGSTGQPADTPGFYFIKVEADPSDEKGQYEVRLLEDHPANEVDEIRFAAERPFMLANLKRDGGTPERREAIDQYLVALASYHKLGALGDPSFRVEALKGEGLTLGFLGYCLGSLNEYLEALKYEIELPQLWRSLQALEPDNTAEDKAGEAQALNNIAFNESSLGRFEEAIGHFNAALPLWTEDIDRMPTLVSLGQTLIEVGQLDKSIETYQRSLTILDGVQHPDAYSLNFKVLTLKGLGIAYYNGKRYKAATDAFEKALAVPGINPTQQANIINGIAGILTQSGRPKDLTRAESEVRRAQKLWADSGFKLGSAIAANNLGKLYEQRGDLNAAISSYKSALETIAELTREYGNSPDLLLEQVVLFNVAHSQHQAGSLIDADTNIGKAIKLLEQTRGEFSDDEYRQIYFASRPNLYELQIAILMKLAQSNPHSDYDVRALQASERIRSRRLVDILGKAISPDVPRNFFDNLNQVQRELAVSRNQWKQLFQGQHTIQERQGVEDRLSKWQAEYDGIVRELAARDPNYSLFLHPEALSLKDIRNLITDDDTVIIEYSLGDKNIYFWAVSKNDFVGKTIAVSRKSVELLVRSLRADVAERNCQVKLEAPDELQKRLSLADERYLVAASRLGSILLSPIAAQLQKKRVVIVADGLLQEVPFAALPDSSRGANRARPLVQNHALAYLPSITALATSRRLLATRSQGSHSVEIFADARSTSRKTNAKSSPNEIPSLLSAKRLTQARRSRGNHGCLAEKDVLVPLPHAIEEARSIAAIAKRAGRVATIESASFGAVLKPEAENSEILHFAAHAFAPSAQPGRSGIVLSQGEAGHSVFGYLGIAEIHKLKLKASLVVLSACETGVGQDFRGEGMVSLARAFMYAGSPRVIASLWNVDDRATGKLMKRFYEGMFSRGLSPAEALKFAQVAMQHDEKMLEWRHPYYWAGFVLEGDWTGLSQ